MACGSVDVTHALQTHCVVMGCFSLLFDKTIKFPPEYSTKKLPTRKSTGRRPSAWCPEREDEEEDPSARQNWCPITVASGPMTLKPKVKLEVPRIVHDLLH